MLMTTDQLSAQVDLKRREHLPPASRSDVVTIAGDVEGNRLDSNVRGDAVAAGGDSFGGLILEPL